MKKKPCTVNLSTPYAVGEVPYNEHPTPQFRRENFTILNGVWQLTVKRQPHTVYDGTVLVPFPPESPLSGVGRVTTKRDVLEYTRTFSVTPSAGKRLLLHFGAVDNAASVLVNGQPVGGHVGGYLPFTLDITAAVTDGENTLTVLVSDALDKTYPYGKQRHKRGGMWYTPISGIWQTVWLEEVPTVAIESLKVTATLDSVTVAVRGGVADKILIFDGKEYSFTGEEITVAVEEPRLWTPETPHIYPFTVKSGEDSVQSYCALRQVDVRTVNGRAMMCLNGKPYFFHGLLDQGYYADGIYLPGSSKGYKQDILRMKALGFNMLRKHIKIEPAVFYYYCDTLGMAVFQDMVNNGCYSFLYDTALPTIGFKCLPKWAPRRVREVFYATAKETVALLYNHPSVVYYTIFNEGWGQHDAKTAYQTLKPLDPTRIWDTASGWFRSEYSDVQSEHVYFKKASFPMRGDKPVVLSEFGGYSCSIAGHVFHPDKVYGYKICATPDSLTEDLRRLYLDEVVPLIRSGLNAAVLTQLSDVEDEVNGLLTYDRQVVKTDEAVMCAIADTLTKAFASTAE